jgi:predicted Zn-dependent protease
MSGIFYRLGRKAGAQWAKTRWILKSVTSDDEESYEAEYELGCLMAREFLNQSVQEEDPAILAIPRELAAQLRERVKEPWWRFSVTVILNPEPNAFALPGGFLYVSRSLLELCDFEPSALGFIIGHEMGHVVKRHAITRLASSSAAGALTRKVLNRTPITRVLAPFVQNLIEKGYSREQELAADGYGARLIRAAGLDPEGGIRLLQRLGELNPEEHRLVQYLSSHPPCSARIEALRELLKA